MTRPTTAGPLPGPAAGPAPLVIACALTIERLALRTGTRVRTGAPARVLRTGMGPEAADRAVSEALRDPALAGAAVVATGF
ncbi:1-hydroxy-2-methyl-2-butenyl 4-diphosphate reductase, partial [Streptomyces sp. SID8014]|nr:1-hydroxy-2-methyl-2-butenyl 4-diphosphate reductase [Streptomyces sp. SID8014]